MHYLTPWLASQINILYYTDSRELLSIEEFKQIALIYGARARPFLACL
jgi:hypothetical protein